MIKFDYHSHSVFSPDSFASLEDMVHYALKRGLTELAITDHMDFYYPSGKLINHTPIKKYAQAVLKAQEIFEGQIKILLGAEFGLRPDSVATATKIANEHDFDFIIGSMHEHADGYGYHSSQFFGGRTKKQAYDACFENMAATVNMCDPSTFDVVGHLDYVERYARYPDKTLHYSEHHETIDALLRAIIDKGKGIEINTAGFAYGLGHAHPRIEILRRYKELGGEIITVGSDAHNSKALGQYFDEAGKMLEQAGIKYITSFKKRKPSMIKI